MKTREFGVLPGSLYDENKKEIKKLFKQHELVFNKGYFMRSRFVWENDSQSVEGFYTKDDDAITIHTELEWIGDKDTELKQELKELILKLGGRWDTREEQEEDELKLFDDQWMKQLIREETSARYQRWEYSPLLLPMVDKYLKEREEKFGLKDKKPEEVIKEVRTEVDKRLGGKK